MWLPGCLAAGLMWTEDYGILTNGDGSEAVSVSNSCRAFRLQGLAAVWCA
jgi:hypothetical protein